MRMTEDDEPLDSDKNSDFDSQAVNISDKEFDDEANLGSARGLWMLQIGSLVVVPNKDWQSKGCTIKFQTLTRTFKA